MIKLGSLFSGIGGFELGLSRAIPGLQITWQVEIDKFCQSILKKHWPESKLFTDVKEVGRHNLKSVDILCGGFPCQDISIAGKGEGLDGEKSSLWFEMFRIIGELRPRIVVMENVPAITFRGLSEITKQISELGYDCEWQIISARSVGACHLRKRWFAVAYPNRARLQRLRPEYELPKGRQKKTVSWSIENSSLSANWKKYKSKPMLCRRNDGVPNRVAKLKALGNSVVPQCAELIGIHLLNSGLIDDLLI